MGTKEGCPFCELAEERVKLVSGAAVAVLDLNPVTEGHTLIIPRRHVESFFDLPVDEQEGVLSLIRTVRNLLDEEGGMHPPEGYTIGINDGAAAGQVIEHAHVHVIPRRFGDVGDCRGGVRWVIPSKARYW